MKITEIKAFPEKLVLTFDGPVGENVFQITARIPLVCGDPNVDFTPGRVLAVFIVAAEEDQVSVPRYAGADDLMLCHFEAACGGKSLDGVCYVTEIDPSVAKYHYDFPKSRLKGISSNALDEDFDDMGFAQTNFGPNQVQWMISGPSERAIPYEFCGRTFYFDKEVVERTDKKIARLGVRGIHGIMRYFNSTYFMGDRSDPKIVKIIQHPGFDYDYPHAYMGAFNIRTEEGFWHFCACTDFLVSRYAREDRKYGWMTSLEVGNEVNSQYMWQNAGPMDCKGFCKEYTEIMRLCWIIARRHYSNFRIHTSFDQFFAVRHADRPEDPGYYPIVDCIEEIAKNGAADGNFPWNVAHHPYPEDLHYPDFWNDRCAYFTFEAPMVTFKNLEVMPAYLAQKHLLYKGEPRRVILSENGFNTRDGEPYTEIQGIHAYVLAYQKMKKIDTIDMFLHHNYVDMPGEFGLNLGIRRFGGHTHLPGERKPICAAIADMDTPREEKRVEEARAFIGPELFDYILNPPAVTPKNAVPVWGGLTGPNMKKSEEPVE